MSFGLKPVESQMVIKTHKIHKQFKLQLNIMQWGCKMQFDGAQKVLIKLPDRLYTKYWAVGCPLTHIVTKKIERERKNYDIIVLKHFNAFLR